MMEPAQAPTESTWDMGLKLEAELTMLNTITLLKKFKTTMTGLTMDEVKKRHSQYGYNEPPKAKETHPIFQILRRFTEPLMAILLVVATVSLVMGQIMSATLVYGMAIVSVLLSFFQEYRAHLEAQKLSGLVSTTATAIRNGRPHEINIRYLVPGDIVDLSAGDIVPADIRILSEKDLYINQAALTGESFPVEKTAEPLAAYASSITAMSEIGALPL